MSTSVVPNLGLKSSLTQLGNKTPLPQSPDEATLETFTNPYPGYNYVVRFDCPEFSSLCLSGETLIDICCNEVNNPKGVKINNLVGTTGLLYSFDINQAKPIVKPYTNVRKTGSNIPTIRIDMEAIVNLPVKGKTRKREISSIELTPEHKVLLANPHGCKGATSYEWVEARNLKIGDRLLPNRRIEGSDLIRGLSRHRLIAEYKENRALETGEDAHHINHNHFDNTPLNIEVKSDSAHSSHHRRVEYGYDSLINIDELVRMYNSDPVVSIASLAKHFRCDDSTISSRLEDRVKLKTQPELLRAKNQKRIDVIAQECAKLYQQGHIIEELAGYFQVSSGTIHSCLDMYGVKIRESNRSRWDRTKLALPALNHKIVNISSGPSQDVYNMEVEDTECFFANDVLVHNCPVTGAPDFGYFLIDYIPGKLMLESKSLKLFLGSFRTVGSFHESCTMKIAERLCQTLKPKWFRISGYWYARGGIAIDVFWQSCQPPKNVCIPDANIPPHRGRG